MPSRSRFDPPVPVLMAAVALFGLSLWLRLSGTGWDGWANLHPDERHMMFVTQDMQRAFEAGRSAGQGWWQLWFGPGSAIDPRAGGRLYVYGDMPLWVVTLTSRWTGVSDWGSTLLLGRSLTAAVDASALLAVFVLALRLTRDAPAALAAAALATLAPTTLQLANFFTADAWLATFCTWALVPMAAMAGQGGRLSHALAAGAFAALAAAGSKHSVSTFAAAGQIMLRSWW